MAARLAAFREAVRCFRAVWQSDPQLSDGSGFAYMQAVRRCQRAFGLEPEDHWDSAEWAFWKRLCDAIHRWGQTAVLATDRAMAAD